MDLSHLSLALYAAAAVTGLLSAYGFQLRYKAQ